MRYKEIVHALYSNRMHYEEIIKSHATLFGNYSSTLLFVVCCGGCFQCAWAWTRHYRCRWLVPGFCKVSLQMTEGVVFVSEITNHPLKTRYCTFPRISTLLFLKSLLLCVQSRVAQRHAITGILSSVAPVQCGLCPMRIQRKLIIFIIKKTLLSGKSIRKWLNFDFDKKINDEDIM